MQGTTLGESNNTAQDLANSLIVPQKSKIDKHEKKEDVDPKKLVSKKSNDTTFSGSLNDIGLDWSGGKLGKPSGNTDADSKQAKQSDSADKAVLKSTGASGEAQTKEQKSTTSKSNEKSAEKSADKEKAKTETADDH